LEDKHQEIYTSVELKLALEEGYKITKLHGVDSYLKRRGLFKEYVELVDKMKIANTRFYTPEECEEINKGFKNEGLDIEIVSDNTCDNLGLRGVAKLFLNSLWGKFGQRAIFTEYACVRSLREMAQYTTNENINIVNIHIIHENLVEIHYERNKETTDPPDYVSPITAAFTTANARVRLAKFLKVLHPSELLYCDIDSCYFVYNPNNPDHVDPRTSNLLAGVERGNGLGQWEIQMSDGKKWAGTGAKSYAAECVNAKHNCLKVKGVTIDFKNKDKITCHAMAKVAQSINSLSVEQQQT